MQEGIHISDSLSELPGLTLNIVETITTTDAIQPQLQALSQTIAAPTFAAHRYGDASLNVTASSSSGLPVTIAVAGPATLTNGTLDLTGAGSVTLTFTQSGNATYAAATPVTRNISVAQAVATLTAQSASRMYAQPNPAFTYTLTGLVHGDTPATLGGSASLTTTAVLNSPAGTYPITVQPGTLPTNNYSYTSVPATLTVIGGTAQTITFLAIPNVPLAVGTLTLSARSSSGLRVSYTVSGPATLNGSKLQLTGAGLVTVTAEQAGNSTYNPAATVTRSFTVAP